MATTCLEALEPLVGHRPALALVLGDITNAVRRRRRWQSAPKIKALGVQARARADIHDTDGWLQAAPLAGDLVLGTAKRSEYEREGDRKKRRGELHQTLPRAGKGKTVTPGVRWSPELSIAFPRRSGDREWSARQPRGDRPI